MEVLGSLPRSALPLRLCNCLTCWRFSPAQQAYISAARPLFLFSSDELADLITQQPAPLCQLAWAVPGEEVAAGQVSAATPED